MPEEADFSVFLRQLSEVIDRSLGRIVPKDRGERLPDFSPEEQQVNLQSQEEQQYQPVEMHAATPDEMRLPEEPAFRPAEDVIPSVSDMLGESGPFLEVPEMPEERLEEESEPKQKFLSEEESQFAAQPSTISREFEVPEGIEPPPDLFVPFESEEAKRRLDDAKGDERPGEDFAGMERLLEFQGNQMNSSRRTTAAITKFFEQAAIDNHRDNQEMERIVEMFLDSRDAITDVL